MHWSEMSAFNQVMAVVATLAAVGLAGYVFLWRRKK
jgi:hypothetical protein